MRRINHHHTRGVTIVEVVVAIGIAAVAIAMVIPVVQKARARIASVSCAGNLQTLSNAIAQYTAEYNNRYPFGFTFNKFNAVNGRPIVTDSSRSIAWFSLLDRYISPRASVVYQVDGTTQYFDGATKTRFASTFKCPAVPSTFAQQIHYYDNPVVMPHLPSELNPNRSVKGLRITAPAKISQVYPDTALLWDTGVWGAAEPDVPSTFWLGPPEASSGFTYAEAGIDGEQVNNPSTPELRYRSPGADRFSTSANPLYNPAGPVIFWSDQTTRAIDPTGATGGNADNFGAIWNFAFGGPRFRHDGVTCNVLFADGSVRALQLRPNLIIYDNGQGTQYVDSDFRRYMLMIKWPPGVVDSNTVATNPPMLPGLPLVSKSGPHSADGFNIRPPIKSATKRGRE